MFFLGLHSNFITSFGFCLLKLNFFSPIFCFFPIDFVTCLFYKCFFTKLIFYWHFYFCYFVLFKKFPIFFYAFAIKICHEVGEYYKVVELFKSFCFFWALHFFLLCAIFCFLVFASVMLNPIFLYLSLLTFLCCVFFAYHFHCNFFWSITPFHLLCFCCVQVSKMVYVDVQFFCL